MDKQQYLEMMAKAKNFSAVPPRLTRSQQEKNIAELEAQIEAIRSKAASERRNLYYTEGQAIEKLEAQLDAARQQYESDVRAGNFRVDETTAALAERKRLERERIAREAELAKREAAELAVLDEKINAVTFDTPINDINIKRRVLAGFLAELDNRLGMKAWIDTEEGFNRAVTLALESGKGTLSPAQAKAWVSQHANLAFSQVVKDEMTGNSYKIYSDSEGRVYVKKSFSA